MPCRVDDFNLATPAVQAKELLSLKKENDLLARFVCGLLRTAEEYNQLEEVLKAYPWAESYVSRADVEEWWRLHKKEDEARIAREKEFIRKENLKKEALAKLSREEKEALGLRRPQLEKFLR